MIDNARDKIIELHEGIITSARRSVKDAVEIGEIISNQKQLLNHGEFLPWVETLPFGRTSSFKYMRLFEYKHKCSSAEHLEEAYKQIESLEYQKKQTKEEQKRAIIAEYRKTGIKVDGWDDSFKYIIKKDDENIKKLEEEKELRLERAEKYKQKEKEATDLYGDILENATAKLFEKRDERHKWKEKIRISDNGKDDSFNDAILEYLDTLDNDSRRIEACNNIVKICRNISIQLQTIQEVKM